MAVCFQLTEKSEYDAIIGRTEGLKKTGRDLMKQIPNGIQASLPEFKDER